MLCSLLTAIGLYASIAWLYENLRAPVLLAVYWLKELAFRKPFSQRYGKWAVITGASDGIGKGYAHYLARQGMSIVLVARNAAKLTTVANEIKVKYGVETKILVADFSNGQEIYANLEKELLPMDVGILVNNVGVASDTLLRLDEVPREELWGLINVNVGAATILCSILVPAMKQRGRGLIVNVSSIASISPAPYITTYSATKAYLTSFSVALREELKPFNVEVQTVRPGFVFTNMTESIASSMRDKPIYKYLVGVEEFMSYAGCTLGKLDMTCGHWSHGLQVAFLHLLPPSARVYLLGRVNKAMSDALKIDQKTKKR